LLTVAGLSAEGVARLPEVEDHPELDACDRAVVRYAEAVTTRSGRMRDAEISDLKEWFTDAQIVELTWRIALCGAFNRFNDALQIQIEPEVTPVSA
jgi:alkylhydroperoxidase family enzyme